MISIVSHIYMDTAQRCVREALTLVHQGRVDEALEVANFAVEIFYKAIEKSKAAFLDAFAALAVRTKHPCEERVSGQV